jgi:hypothetical protein
MNRIWICICGLFLLGCAADPAILAPKERPAAPDQAKPADVDWQSEPRWDAAKKQIGKGTFKDGVYTITLPRTDLEVNHIEFGPIPPGAGLESRIFFWGCECGKTMMIGQLCATDYEVNDVIDELRGGNIKVTGIAPVFIGDKPRMMAIHFQAEGADETLLPALRKALHWMGQSSKPVIDTNPHIP